MNLLAYVTTIALCTVPHCQCFECIETNNSVGLLVDYNFVQLTKAGIKELCQYRKIYLYILNAIGALFVWNDEEVEQ